MLNTKITVATVFPLRLALARGLALRLRSRARSRAAARGRTRTAPPAELAPLAQRAGAALGVLSAEKLVALGAASAVAAVAAAREGGAERHVAAVVHVRVLARGRHAEPDQVEAADGKPLRRTSVREQTAGRAAAAAAAAAAVAVIAAAAALAAAIVAIGASPV